LKDQVGKHSDVRSDDQDYYPKGFNPAGNIVASKQITGNGYEQPKPHNEDEYRESVHQKISKSETFLNE
jgi:hypothetical protein